MNTHLDVVVSQSSKQGFNINPATCKLFHIGPYKDGVAIQVGFPNGHGVSIIKYSGSYGGEHDMWEIAHLVEGDGTWPINSESTVIDGGVEGWMTPESCMELVNKIAAL